MTDDHPKRGRLLAHLDGELEPGARRAVEEHLERCGRCRDRLERYREWSSMLSETAKLVDVPEPEMDLPAPDRATDSGKASEETEEPDVVPIGPFRRAATLRAAAVVLLLGGGAFAVTSTPLQAWADDLLDRVGALFGSGDARPVAEAPREGANAGADAARPSAASIRPRKGSVEVTIWTTGSDLPVVRVGFRRSSAAVVEAPGASFGTSSGRLVVNASGTDTLLVELPESLSDGRVEVNGRSLLRVEGGEVSHDVAPDKMNNGDFLYRPGR